jgi:hypothetical protein
MFLAGYPRHRTGGNADGAHLLALLPMATDDHETIEKT